jgi:drug/metabolite transporter (DMT)-like permease
MSTGNKFPAIIMALLAAIFWGISGTCAQFLFEQKGQTPIWLVSWRLLIAGLILTVYSGFRKNSDVFAIWKKPKDIVQLLIFAVFGMAAVQYTYFKSIDLSNAATATVLQYIGPLFVVAFYAFKHRKWPVILEYASLVLALVGTFLLVTHGSFQQLVISESALVWGLLSALTLAAYSILPVQLLRRYSPATVTGWGMLLGGIVFSFFADPFSVQGVWDSGTWLAFSYIIIFGSLIAFYIYLYSISIIGASTASMLCCTEPLAAAAVAVLWLNVNFTGVDWIGTICILLTIILLTLGTRKQQNPECTNPQ